MNRFVTLLILFHWISVQSYASTSGSEPAVGVLSEIACNDLVNISLDTNCMATVTVPMLLQGNIGPISDYTIHLKYNGQPQNDLILGQQDVGHVIDFTVWHLPSGNSCWGKIKVEEKYPPQMECRQDTVRCNMATTVGAVGFPIPSWIEPSTSVVYDIVNPNRFFVYGWDKCGVVILSYYDQIVKHDCSYDCIATIYRNWTAEDVNGNVSKCTQTICIRQPQTIDLNTLYDYDGISRPHLSCDGVFPKLEDGNPSPEYTGHPVPEACGSFVATYDDLRIDICEGSYKVIRRWTILNWCTKEIIQHNQLIKVIDDKGPKFQSPADFTVGMEPYSCGSNGILPSPLNVEDCAGWRYDIFVKLSQDDELAPLTKDYVIYNSFDKHYHLKGAPPGRVWLVYVLTDSCGNSSRDTTEVGVVDDLPPVAICDQRTVVTLSGDGFAKLFANSLDNGSIDNCTLDSFAVRRMTNSCSLDTSFREYVELCCEDVGDTVMVSFMAVDEYGNSNTCMVQVIVQDKLPPVIVPPTDITINCDYPYDLNHLEEFGSLRTSESDRKQIIIKDPIYSAVGFVAGIDGLVKDNCTLNYRDTFETDIQCHQGVIRRYFYAEDKQGQVATAVQNIYIVKTYLFNQNGKDIEFPQDAIIRTCRNVQTDPKNTGEPIFYNAGCAQVLSTHTDTKLVSQDSACYKIIRKWRVIDWCQYDQRTGAGQWEGTQVIQVKNSEAPNIFSCQDTIFNDKEAYRDPISNLCYGHYDMTALGDDDCTPEAELVWSYKIDIHDDGTYEPEQKGSRAMGVLPVDTHRIRWIVQDKCGNYSQCDRLFVIRDDKKPTPYCKSGIVTVVMQTNGQVLVKAIDLEQNSFDNCTEHSKLVFSFSSDTTIKTILYTCDSLEGQTVINKTVRLYVTDEAGNQDFCETFVRIQDNNNACNNTGIVVSGGIFNMRNEPMLGAQVSVERSSDHQILYSVLSDGAGEYTFQDVKAALFEINAEMGDYITNGVTTYDIVLLQKHILGISEIKDPFKLMAADVNKTNNLTARDISEIRKVILGVSSQFSGVPIWQFVDKRFKYNQQVGWTNAPNKILSSSLNGIYTDVDFVGIKSGDIDQSANFGNQNGIVRQNETRTWKLIKEENNHRVAVVSTQKQLISGFQLALQLGSTQAYNLESGKIQVQADDYLELQQQLRISWAAKSDVSVEKDDVLFYIKSSGSSIPSFELSEIWMPAQVYDAAGNQYSIKLIPNEEYQEKIGSLVLYQNTPNPFSLSTTINFEINVDCEAKLEVFSMTGKKVLSRLMQAKAGINPLIILKSDLDGSGMFYYQIEAKGQKKAQKMILID